MSKTKSIITSCICAAFLFLGAGCETLENLDPVAEYPTRQAGDQEPVYGKREGIFGKGGLFSASREAEEGQGKYGLGVNAFLWRASLDTLSFMPLESADPFGGTIITDWYVPDPSKNERFRANAFILDRQLRADGIRVSVFRQTLSKGGWTDAPVSQDTARQLEDTILTRARELRIAQAAAN